MNVNDQTRSQFSWDRLLSVAAVFIACVCLCAVPLRGQGILISPLIVYTSLLPGESRTVIITVYNDTNADLLFIVTKKDWDARHDGSVEVLEPGTIASSLCDWFTFDKQEFEVKAGATEELVLSITRPEDALEAAYWGGFSIEPVGEISEVRLEEGVGFKVKAVFVGVILQSDPTVVERSGRITAMDVQVADSQPEGERTVAVSATVANTCRNILRTDVRFEVRDVSGNVVATQELKDRAVLPNHARIFTASFTADDWPPGQYLALVIVDYGGETLTGGQWPFEIPEE